MYKLNRKLKLTEPLFYNTGIWIPGTRSLNANVVNINLTPHKIHKLEGITILHWKFQGILPTNTLIDINEEVSNLPPPPPKSQTYIQSCLQLDKPLTKLNQNTNVENLLKTVKGINASETVENIITYIVNNYIYEYPPKIRNAQDVIESKISDCGGYHAVFVGVLRLLGIPAVLDIGARLPDCSPHVWAWWWNQEISDWVMIDINDMQNKQAISDRVSFSLDTGHDISTFPRQIQFIQNFLMWDWCYNFHNKFSQSSPAVDFDIFLSS